MRWFTILIIVLSFGCTKHSENGDSDGPRLIFEQPDNATEEESAEFVDSCRSKLMKDSVSVGVAPRQLSDGPYHWTTIPYRLEPNEKTLQLFAKVTLDLRAIEESERSTFLNRLQLARQCVRDFYLRHAIFLHLEFLEPKDAGSATEGDASYVYIRKAGTRVTTFNMNNWAFAMDGVSLNDDQTCTVVAHEFGHMLGLRDEYFDANVSARVLGHEDSVMRSCHLEPKDARLYPKHLRTIFKHACSQQIATEAEASIPMMENYQKVLPF